MKNLLLYISILFIALNQVKGQTIEEIDSLRKYILENIEQFESLEYSNKEIFNSDAVGFDTLCFYSDRENLVYIKKKETSHTFHLTGDTVDITELYFLDGQVVFRRGFGYQFVNSQWDKEPELNKTEVRVFESTRSYYSLDGSAIIEYESREAEGKYEDRFKLLENIPLKEVRRLIWTDRCDECIEEEYLSIYQKLLEKKAGK